MYKRQAHWYLGMGIADEDTSELEYMREILKEDVKKLKNMEKTVPVIVGEWCLAHNLKPDKEYTELEKQLSYKPVSYTHLYEDAAYFARIFKNQTGITPSEYRENKSR